MMMGEPFEMLLGHLRDHPLLAPYLEGDKPDFAGITASDAWMRVSTGELILLQVALSIYNGDGAARFSEFWHLDEANRHRVLRALEYMCGVRQ